jgi:hypothetical protein
MRVTFDPYFEPDLMQKLWELMASLSSHHFRKRQVVQIRAPGPAAQGDCETQQETTAFPCREWEPGGVDMDSGGAKRLDMHRPCRISVVLR